MRVDVDHEVGERISQRLHVEDGKLSAQDNLCTQHCVRE